MTAPKILLADEDTEMISVLALHLRNEEYDVVCASDGDSALAAAERHQPDLILMDVSLEINDRDRLSDEISEHPALVRTPIIFLVGERSVRVGTVPKVSTKSMIIKPVPTRELFEKIEQALARAADRRSIGRPARREKAA